MPAPLTQGTPAYEDEILKLYQSVLGRAPDNSGLAWWTDQNNPQVAQWLQSGGTPKLEAAFRSGIPQGSADATFNTFKTTNAPNANQLTQPGAQQWQDYMTKAAAEQQGMNNMPGVFNGYAGLATATPEQAFQTLYRSPEGQQQAIQNTIDTWNTALPSQDDKKKRSGGGFGALGGILG